jgi:hypothetical protein
MGVPPKGLMPFIWHYIRDALPMLILMSFFTALIAVGEVALFGFLGGIVDWLAEAERENFFEREGQTLLIMSLVLLIGLPLATFLQGLIVYQGLMGNVPMSARWRMHRQMLGQSMGFFGNEYAGRVATKVMQTSLSVREAVMKVLDVFVFVIVYFLSALALVGAADPAAHAAADPLGGRLWRRALVVRPAPRQDRRSSGRCPLDHDRPHRRFLHQHPDRETLRPFRPGGNLRPQLDGRLPRYRPPPDADGHGLQHHRLCQQFAARFPHRRRRHLYLWMGNQRRGWSRWRRHRALRIWGCRNGSCGSSRSCSRTSARCATASARSPCRIWSRRRPKRRISSSPGRDRVRPCPLPLRQAERRHRGPVAEGRAGREDRRRRPLGRGQVDAGQPAPALLRHRGRAHSHRRAGHRRGHPGFAARPYRRRHPGHLAPPPLGARQHRSMAAPMQPRR